MDLSALNAPHAMLLAAAETALVGLVGLGVSNYRKYRHERFVKRLEAWLAHVNEQIKDYYGPLYTLAQHVRIIHQTRLELINGLNASETPPDISEIRRIVRTTWTSHFRPGPCPDPGDPANPLRPLGGEAARQLCGLSPSFDR